jgi:hypothetical protein
MAIDEDMIMMKDGRVMIVRNGEMVPMEEEMTMSDGKRVSMDGKVVMPDGTSRFLMEGEAMDMDGRLVDAEAMTDKQFKEEMEDEELRDDIH